MRLPKTESVGPFKNWPKVAPQILVTASASWAVLCTGLVRGWSSPSIPLLTMPNNESIFLEPSDAAWMASMSPLCALIGSLLISLPMEMYGRRWTLIGSSLPFALGFFLMGVSHYVRSTPLLYIGRIITGLVSGATTPTAQIYVSECSSPRIRGTLGSFTATFMSIGILISYSIGSLVDWHVLCFLLGSFPLVLGLAMIFMPETPGWLLSKQHDQMAKKALQQLRGRYTNVEEEFQRIRNDQFERESGFEKTGFRSRVAGLTSATVMKPLAISVALMFFQQFSGINGVIFYSVTIFEAAGNAIDRSVSSISIAAIQLICTLMSSFLVDRFGRRILLLLSGAFMALPLLALGTFFHLKLAQDSQEVDKMMETMAWLPLVCLILYIVAYSAGYSAVPYVVMGELFPIRYRNILGSLSTSFNLACSFTVVRTFPEISRHVGMDFTFWFYGVCCAVGFAFVLAFLPETKGRALEDISVIFARKKQSIEDVEQNETLKN